MRVVLVALSLVLLWSSSSARPNPQNPTLRLIHVVFRHGDRNPDEGSLYESNPFYDEIYYPEGYGQLTNQGKRTEFNLGRLLRRRFDRFLGDTWNINYLDVRSTDVNRTKMSAELVSAGLWAPKRSNVWNRWLDWQPIPYNYYSTSADPEMYGLGCSTFYTKLNALLVEPELATYFSERYGAALQVLNDTIGVNSVLDASGIYFGLLVQEQLGFPLEEWTKQVYPEPLHSLTVDAYYLYTNTTELRQIISGSLLKKILSDTGNLINGTLSPSTRKMFLYSGHEFNVGSMVLSLDAFKLADVPAYGSHVIFEVHEIDGVHGFKIFYGDYTTPEPHGPLIIPGCAEFCPFDDFSSLVQEIIPSSDAACYGS